MEKKETVLEPINGVVEPDFLEYLTKTFKHWQQLANQGTTLGVREIAKFENTLNGARINARYGFEATIFRGEDEDGNQVYRVRIFTDRKARENENPIYIFETPISE